MVIEKISETISMLKNLDKGTLEGWRYTLFFFIVIDIFLFYWYMKWKTFAVAALLVSCVILAVILILERKFPPEKEEEDKELKKKQEEWNKSYKPLPKPQSNEQEQVKGFLYMDLGLPNPEDYNKRLDQALGG